MPPRSAAATTTWVLRSKNPLRVDLSYEVVRQENVWQLAYVSVCPAPKFAASCGRAVEYNGRRYGHYANPPGMGSGVAADLGTGRVLDCGPEPVDHIGIYSASEQPASEKVIVVTRDQHSPETSDMGEYIPTK